MFYCNTQNLESGRRVHVGETFNTFADTGAVNCTKMRLAAGLRLDPLGSYSAPPDLLSVIRGWEGGKGKKDWEWGWVGSGGKGRT